MRIGSLSLENSTGLRMGRRRICTLGAVIFSVFMVIGALGESHTHDQDASDDEDNQKPVYKSPTVSGFAYLAEHFDDRERFSAIWVQSQAKKEEIDEDIAKYDGVWAVEEPSRSVQDGDLGLVLKSKARHAAIAALLNKPFKFEEKPLVVQYEVNFQEGQECGGAYLKLLTQEEGSLDLTNFHDKTPYTIMFGPDKCGTDHKLHFIFRHKNPINGSIEEKHSKKAKERLEDYFKDKVPHLYTLIVRSDNSFQVKVDGKIVNEGSLLDDFTPPVNPPLEIEDPNDIQPEDWDDREKIPDPTAVKPEDWDEDAPAQIVDEDDVMPEDWLENEPPTIPNPDSAKPDDWDVEMDGEWEPPEIPNPKCEGISGCGVYKQKLKKNPRYKGKWLPALINNPNYKGQWKPRLVHNPEYFNDQQPFKMMPIGAIGFELWSMSPDILFDNLIITDDEDVAKQWADDTFEIRRKKIAQEGSSVWRRVANFTSENPWIWAVYIVSTGLPLLLIIYCCCFSSKDSSDDEKDPLAPTDETKYPTPDGNANPEDEVPRLPRPDEPLNDNNENHEETDEIIASEKDEQGGSGDGPRRRKPNKE
ncbi:calnexin isoform X2 [Diachasma alloeum]|uniref:calnexin isoform X2 n=1 Tax=Diachasma alloeum TaxID=454923 RepID=UPI000738384D|nr:calnexin isoform X2 [Diachasma alloeum]